MPEVPRVSVIMAVRDGAPYLQQAVDSILAQTFTDFEFVIVDDGSTDSTPDVLRRCQAADPRIRVYFQEKAGLVPSLNRACGHAMGSYLARMDADDIAFQDRLERQVEFLDRHPQVALVGSAVVRIDHLGREIKRNVSPTTHVEIVRALAEYNCFTHSTVMLRADMLRAVGGYREAYLHAEDYDLWLRLAERYELANLSDPLLYYRVYAEQVSMRQLEQQLVSVVGAREAARERQSTGKDRTPARGPITPELLREWGVAEIALAEAMAHGYRYAAYQMLQVGLPDQAIEVLRIGRRLSKGHGDLNAMLAGVCSKQAKAALQGGRFIDALSWGTEAWRAQPSLPLQLLRRGISGMRPGIRAAGRNP